VLLIIFIIIKPDPEKVSVFYFLNNRFTVLIHVCITLKNYQTIMEMKAPYTCLLHFDLTSHQRNVHRKHYNSGDNQGPGRYSRLVGS